MKLCPQCTTGFPDTASSCPTHGGVLSEIRDLKPGMVIRRTYQIVRKLGQGGMGSVYLARQTLMDEPRALKFLASEFSSDPAFTSRFLREVRNLRQVRHKNVVDCGDLEPAVLQPAVPEPAALEPSEADEASPRKRFPFIGETIIAAVVLIVIFFSWEGSRDRNPGPVIDSSTQGQVAGQPEKANSETAQPDTSLSEEQAETLLKQNEYQQAAPLFDQACTGGNATACANLGSLYANGQGVAANHVTAAEFFDKACNGGLETACIKLSNAYLAGDGVVTDKDKANELLKKACTLGDTTPCNGTKN